MTPENYKRWRLGLGYTTARDLAEKLGMATISISTYESKGSSPSADAKILNILEEKIRDRSDDFINAVVDCARRLQQVNNDFTTYSTEENIFRTATRQSIEETLDNSFPLPNEAPVSNELTSRRIDELERRIKIIEDFLSRKG